MSISLNAQPIPSDFFKYKIQKLLFDYGENWSSYTLFSGIRYQEYNKLKGRNVDSTILNTKIGVHIKNQSLGTYAYGYVNFQNFFYSYLYSRIVNDTLLFQGYSGLPVISYKNSYLSSETDLSGIGFQNSWVTLQIGRGRENWGAGENIQLALSESSCPYDYILLASDYGNLRVNYIHGFLETTKDTINRYITARGIEWTNKRNILFGLSEVIIYSGLRRSIDIGYFNPIGTHLEIELNERLNNLGANNANAVWMLSADYYIKKYNIRMSYNLLFDEFVIDEVEKNNNKEHGKAYSYRLAYTPLNIFSKLRCTSYFSFVYVGTPTFRHIEGTNNFVHKGLPIGWPEGSDSEKLTFGLNISNHNNIITSLEISRLKVGEETIRNNIFKPYKDYTKSIFPSGDVIKIDQIKADLEYWIKPNFAIFCIIEYYNNSLQGDYNKFAIGFNINYPVSLNL